MSLSREDLLVLLLYTSPKTREGYPVVFGSTRLQKLVFLAQVESEIIARVCSDVYDFVPYDYGPYSEDLERDARQFADSGWMDPREAEALSKEPEELSFEYITGFMNKRPHHADIYVLKGPKAIEVSGHLQRLEAEGVDTKSLLKEFRDLHARHGSLELDDLLRYVYEKYPPMAEKTKRPDLRPEPSDGDWDEEDMEYDS